MRAYTLCTLCTQREDIDREGITMTTLVDRCRAANRALTKMDSALYFSVVPTTWYGYAEFAKEQTEDNARAVLETGLSYSVAPRPALSGVSLVSRRRSVVAALANMRPGTFAAMRPSEALLTHYAPLTEEAARAVLDTGEQHAPGSFKMAASEVVNALYAVCTDAELYTLDSLMQRAGLRSKDGKMLIDDTTEAKKRAS